MNKIDKIRNSIVLGGLLHDIGKVMNRIDEHKMKAHPLCSVEFVGMLQNLMSQKSDWENLYNQIDFRILSNVCKKHHEWYGDNKEYVVDSLEKEEDRVYSYIVSRADNFSSSERMDGRNEDKKDISERDKERLISIFSKIYAEDIANRDFPKYPIMEIDDDFYDREKAGYEYKDIWYMIGEKIKNLAPTNNFDLFYNNIWNILRRYTFFIPSDTRKEQDISLFSHLTTTAAIAECIYYYHKDTGTLDEEKVKDDSLERFLLVEGTITPIQKFIFDIASNNPKRLSKILRGRSFYVSLISEVIALYIIKKLELSISCILLSGGSKFTILAPNTEKTKNILKNIEDEIYEIFLKEFLLNINFVLDYNVCFEGKGFGKNNYCNIVEKAKKSIASKKYKIKYNLNKFEEISKSIYEKYKDSGDFCSFCGRYLIVKDSEERYCDICRQSEKIGENLVKSSYIVIGNNINGSEERKIKLFKDILNIDIYFSKNAKEAKNIIKENRDIWIIWQTNRSDENEKNEDIRINYIEKNVQNYLPEAEGYICKEKKIDKENGISLCAFCSENCPYESNDGEKTISRKDLSILTFQCISAYTKKRNYEENKNDKESRKEGAEYLGLLKGDVDNLGEIIKNGFKVGNENQLTISRLYTFSYLLDYFFTGIIKKKIKDEKRLIYTIYSGGDDFALIGPWEEIINFAFELRNEFDKYVYNEEKRENIKKITFSSGISIFKPRTPVKVAIEFAEDNLKKAKNLGNEKNRNFKNGFSVFNTVLRWNEYTDKIDKFSLIEYKDRLLGYYKEEIISRGLLYKFLIYKKMYDEIKNGSKDISNYLYHSNMFYSLNRNVYSKFKDEKYEEKQKELIDFFEPLYSANEDKFLLGNIDFIINWIAYKTRRG